jgi:hypothetical protein
MNHRIRGLAVALVAAGTLTVPAIASDPLGVFCIVDKVVLEPPDCPERAQVWGACAVARSRDNQFDRAARGYFYYSVPKGREDVARAEWMDLKAVAGTGAIVGFGGRGAPAGRFRVETEKPASPDVYPLNTGVVKLAEYFARDYYRGVADDLRALIRR